MSHRTAYIDADLHDPDKILGAAAKTRDFTTPTALMLMGILGGAVAPRSRGGGGNPPAAADAFGGVGRKP